MKKLLLVSALAFAGLTVNAQNLTVTVDGAPVVRDAEVTSHHINEVLLQFGSLKLEPEVLVTVSEQSNLDITVFNVSQNTTQAVQFCWPSFCDAIEPGQSTTNSNNVNANEPQNLAIDATIYPFDKDNVYELKTVVEIVVNGNTEDSFVFNLNMVYDPNYDASVGGIVADEAEAVYYDLSGRRVLNPDKGIYVKKQGSLVSKVLL